MPLPLKKRKICYQHFELPSPEMLRPECELFGKPQDPHATQKTPEALSIDQWIALDRPKGDPFASFLQAGNADFSDMVKKACSSPEAAAAIRHKIVRQWQYFFYHTAENHQPSVDLAVQCALDIVASLNGYALRNDKPMRQVGRRFAIWPIRHSPHALLREEPEKLSKSLDLGAQIHFLVHATARWNPNDLATQIALRLVFFVQNLRENSQVLKKEHPEKEFISEAGRLSPPSLRDDNIEAWWIVAKAVLEDAFPEPYKVAVLQKLLTAPSHRKSAGVMNFRILQKIEYRFKSLFGFKRHRREKA